MEGQGKRGLTTWQSRLSPLAQPFSPQPILNLLANSCHEPITPSLEDSHHSDSSFSLLDFSTEDDLICNVPLDGYEYYGNQTDMGMAALPYDNPLDFDPQSYYPRHPSLAFQGKSNSAVPYESKCDPMPFTKSSNIPNYNQNLLGFRYVDSGNRGADWTCDEDLENRTDHQENFFRKEGLRAYESVPNQGKHAAEGLKPCGETSNITPSKLTGMILGRNNLIKSRGTEQVDVESFPELNSRIASTKFSTSSDMCSSAIVQNIPQTQLSYPTPVMTWSSCYSDVASYKRSFSQVDSSSAEHSVYLLPKNNSPALSFGLSGASTSVSPLNPVLSVNTDYTGFCALNNNENSSGSNLFSIKGKERKNGKLVSDDGMDPLLMAKSELQITNTNVSYDSSLQAHGAKSSVSVECTSKMLDQNDSDLDSPCWKGTQPSSQSPFKFSGSVSSQCLEHGLETSDSLNPLAPHFFPSNVKGSIDFCEKECVRSDFSSFRKGTSSALNLSSRDHGYADSVKVGLHHSELGSGIGTQCYNYIHEAEKEYALVNSLRGSSLLTPDNIGQPCLEEDYFTSNGRHVISANVEGSLKRNKDVVHSSSTSVSVLAKEHVLSPSSSGFGLLTETRHDVFKSLSAPPKVDVQTVVNAMHNLSELLFQNCSNGFSSLNEHDHDIIELIINNLCVFTKNKVGQRTPTPKSTHTGTSYCPNKSTEHCKHSSMELNVAWTKAMAVQHEPDNQNAHMEQKSCSTALTEKGLHSFSSCSDVGTKKDNDMIQVIRKALRENYQINEEMHPQALVYRNLWLEAEAALCSLKYKTCVLGMKSNGMWIDANQPKHKESGKLFGI